jgi:hypothetical protein
MSILEGKYKKSILIWQIIGIFVIFGLGYPWHFIYEWVGQLPKIGWLFPVNESVWEHVKLMYYPALLYYLVESIFLFKKSNNFLFAKMIALYLTPTISISVFYIYTAFIEANFIIDVIALVIATILQQILCYVIMTRKEIWTKRKNLLNAISATAIAALGVMLIIFTYFPPFFPLFEDMIYNKYGIFPH